MSHHPHISVSESSNAAGIATAASSSSNNNTNNSNNNTTNLNRDNNWLHSNKLRRLYTVNNNTGRSSSSHSARRNRGGKYFNRSKQDNNSASRKRKSKVEGAISSTHDVSDFDNDSENNSDNNDSEDSSEDGDAYTTSNKHDGDSSSNSKNHHKSNNNNSGSSSSSSSFQIGHALSNLLYGRTIDSKSGPASQRMMNASQINGLMIANLDSSLVKYIYSARKASSDSDLFLLKEQGSVLDSDLKNETDNSKILQDILRRQGGTRFSNKNRPGRRRQQDEDDDEEDFSSDEDDDELYPSDVKNDTNNATDDNNNNRGSSKNSSPDRGEDSPHRDGTSEDNKRDGSTGYVTVGGDNTVVPAPRGDSMSPSSRSPSPASPRRLKGGRRHDHRDRFLPSIMKGLKVDLTKQAEQAQQAAQQLLDSRKSLAYDSRHLLRGAVHSSHDVVRKYSALLTQQHKKETSPRTSPTVKRQETDPETGESKIFITALAPTLPESNLHSNRARGITSKSARGSTVHHRRGTTTPLGKKQQQRNRHQQNAEEETSDGGPNANKNQAVQYLFMTECKSPNLNSIVIPKASKHHNEEDVPPLNIMSSNQRNGEEDNNNKNEIKNTGLKLIPTSDSSSSTLLIPTPPSKLHINSRQQQDELIDFEDGGGSFDSSGSPRNQQLSFVPAGSTATIEELLLFDRKKNVDLHHQNYRPCAQSARQPKLPKTHGQVGSARKLRKFISRVNDSAVEHGRYGIREFNRAWHAHREFREERKNVMNLLLDDHKRQFEAPQAMLLEVRRRMKAVAAAKDHRERLDYFFDHIKNVRPFIPELFPENCGSPQLRHHHNGATNKNETTSENVENDSTSPNNKNNNNNNQDEDPNLENTSPSPTNRRNSTDNNNKNEKQNENEKSAYDPKTVLSTETKMLSPLAELAHKFLDELEKAIVENDGLNNGLSQLDEIAFPNTSEEWIMSKSASSRVNAKTKSALMNGTAATHQQQSAEQSPSSNSVNKNSPNNYSITSSNLPPIKTKFAKINDNNTPRNKDSGKGKNILLPGQGGSSSGLSSPLSPATSTILGGGNKSATSNTNNNNRHVPPSRELSDLSAGTYQNNNNSSIIESKPATGSVSVVSPRSFSALIAEPKKVFDNEHIHLENVVNLLALVAPLFGATQEEFGQWVLAKRNRHENRDKAVAVQVAKSAFSSSSEHIDAHFNLFVYNVRGVWRGVGNLNRARAYLRFSSEDRVLVSTSRAPLKACTWGDDTVYSVTLKDHNSTVLVQLVGEGETILSSGTFNVDGVGWKRLQPMTVEMNGISNCVCHVGVEMDFPQVLSSTVRRKTQMLGSLPQPGVVAKQEKP